MSEISEKLKLKLSRSQKAELILNIILAVWAIVTFVCIMADVAKIHAVIMAIGITGFLITVIDGYFIFAVFYYKRKIFKQNQKDGIIQR